MSHIHDFKNLITSLHGLLDVMEHEVLATIDKRDPFYVSSGLAQPSSEALLTAYRKYGQLSDKLALFASDPSDHITTIAGEFHESNALQVVAELGVADALETNKVPLFELAAKVGADPVRLRQFMRALLNRSIFCETEFGSDIYANNRISSVLLSARENNLLGMIGHWCNDSYRAGVSIVPSVRADHGQKSAFEIYHGMSIWDYFKTAEGAAARERLNKAMIAAEPLLHGTLISGHDWLRYGEEFLLIDVGGGIGGASIEFARRFPKIRIIIQDQASVLKDAPKFWDEHAPECKSRVEFMPHDFFTPQPHIDLRGPHIYFLRMVLHDWKDEDCVRILQPIVAAMKGHNINDSRLYIADIVMDEESDRFKYMVSLQMMTFAGAEERTERQFRTLLGGVGLKIEGIWKNPGMLALIECTVA